MSRPHWQQRYDRHLALPDFGPDEQEALSNASVLLVGVGGLGAPAAQYLAAAGVGTLGLLDFDRVDQSNLQRQVLFVEDDIGRLKVEAARDRLQAMNSTIDIVTHTERLDAENARRLFEPYDLVIDGSDNVATRYLVNDACVFMDITLVYASIFRYEGQVSVFNWKEGPNYRDLFPTPPAPGTMPSCAEAGVLGVLPGVIGSLQATEAIKIITGVGQPLCGKLLLFDAKSMRFNTISLVKNEDNPLRGTPPSITKLLDYEAYCSGIDLSGEESVSMRVEVLREWCEKSHEEQLIDVRTEAERREDHIGGKHIPIDELSERVDELPHEEMLVFYCQSGQRSLNAVRLLQQYRPDQTTKSLSGGMAAYRSKYPRGVLHPE